eukprot:gene20578-7536_t
MAGTPEEIDTQQAARPQSELERQLFERTQAQEKQLRDLQAQLEAMRQQPLTVQRPHSARPSYGRPTPEGVRQDIPIRPHSARRPSFQATEQKEGGNTEYGYHPREVVAGPKAYKSSTNRQVFATFPVYRESYTNNSATPFSMESHSCVGHDGKMI